MPTIYEFSKQIREYCKSKDYNAALNFFKNNKQGFDPGVIASNHYLVADMLSCLRHINYFDAGYKFLHNYGIIINENTPEIILTAYGWLLYDHFKSEHNTSNEEIADVFDIPSVEEESNEIFSEPVNQPLIAKIEGIIKLLGSFNSVFSTNVMSFLFNSIMKAEKAKPRPDWNFVVSFCDIVLPEKLTKDCSTIKVERKGVMKDMELASAYESWFAYITKALLETRNYERCYELSKQALEIFEKFHYSNDVWFARRIALCKKQLGNIDEAISELESILRKKKEWFILKELAEMHFEKGNFEKSYHYAIQGINAHGELEYKIELLELMGTLLKQMGEELLSYQHLMLVVLIREENGWKESQAIHENLTQYKNQPIYLLRDKPELIKILSAYWRNEISKPNLEIKKTLEINTKRHIGIVSKLLNPTEKGKQGFITGESGGKFYFFIAKDNELHDSIKVGLKVTFKTEPDKNGKGDRAVSIKKQI